MTMFHDLFIHVMYIKICVCVRLPVFPFFSVDSDDSASSDDSDDSDDFFF